MIKRLLRLVLACALFSPSLVVDQSLAAPTPVAPASDANLACMADNVYHEARGEPTAGMVAVGQVVVNRMKDGRTPCAIIHEKKSGHCQFSWVCSARHRVEERVSWQKSMAVAKALIKTKTPPPDPTSGATSFATCRTFRVAPTKLVLTAKIGHHCFYRQKTVPPKPQVSVNYELVPAPSENFALVVSKKAEQNP